MDKAKNTTHRLWLATEKLCDECAKRFQKRTAFVISKKRPVVFTDKCGCRFLETDPHRHRQAVCEESLTTLGIPTPKPGTVVEFELKPKKGKRNA